MSEKLGLCISYLAKHECTITGYSAFELQAHILFKYVIALSPP